jgi:alkanesulfonate monooxygenase SsuD/methylene tetrahydromethanopterin reductase-like flavin-dependent oxidoreductase (luciferase family)
MPTRFRIDEANVAWRITDDEAVVLHADSSAYFGLNRVGTAIWIRLTESPMTVDQLTAWAGRAFTGTPDSAADDITEFVEALQGGDLLIAEEGTAGDVESTTGQAIPWDKPVAECFGQLEKLILSGE